MCQAPMLPNITVYLYIVFGKDWDIIFPFIIPECPNDLLLFMVKICSVVPIMKILFIHINTRS